MSVWLLLCSQGVNYVSVGALKTDLDIGIRHVTQATIDKSFSLKLDWELVENLGWHIPEDLLPLIAILDGL